MFRASLDQLVPDVSECACRPYLQELGIILGHLPLKVRVVSLFETSAYTCVATQRLISERTEWTLIFNNAMPYGFLQTQMNTTE